MHIMYVRAYVCRSAICNSMHIHVHVGVYVCRSAIYMYIGVLYIYVCRSMYTYMYTCIDTN